MKILVKYKLLFYLCFIISYLIVYSKNPLSGSFGIFTWNLLLLVLFLEGHNFLRRSVLRFSELGFVSALFFFSLLFRILIVGGVLSYFSLTHGNLLGENPADELQYYKDAVEIFNGNYKFIINSDLGAALYYGLIFKVFGVNIVYAKLCNSLIAAIIPVQIFFLLKKLVDNTVARNTAILACVFPYLLILTGTFLKETIMLSLVVASLSYIYKLKETFNLRALILFGIFTLLVFLFRSLIGLSLIITFLYVLYLKNKDRKIILLFSVFLGIICFMYIILFSPLFSEIIGQLNFIKNGNFGAYLQFLASKDGIVITPIMYFQLLIVSIIGPIPKVLGSSTEYILLFSPHRLIKLMLFPFIFIGFRYAYYNLKQLRPLFLFICINFVGIWLVGFFLLDRYQVIFYPIYLLFVSLSFYDLNLLRKVFKPYMFFCFLLILIWNLR